MNGGERLHRIVTRRAGSTALACAMRNLLAILSVLACCGATAARATESSPVLVELFTSQGCSSCPPADALLAELAARHDVIALSLHVDYWDYLGWKDSFSSHRMTERQQAYAKALGGHYVYTPQIVIDGREQAVGSDRDAVTAEIARARTRPHLSLTVESTPAQSVLRVSAGRIEPARIWLIGIDPRRDVSIARGENAGQTISYYNVSRSWQDLGAWHGKRVEIPLPASLWANGEAAYIAMVQAVHGEAEPGAILGAVRVDPPPAPIR